MGPRATKGLKCFADHDPSVKHWPNTNAGGSCGSELAIGKKLLTNWAVNCSNEETSWQPQRDSNPCLHLERVVS